MGPDTYDLVSLLRDSYVDLSASRRSTTSSPTSWRCKGPPAQEREFRRRFDLMALQRNLKALGTFGYQTAARRTRSTSSTSRARCATCAPNLDRHPRFGRLRELLAQHLDEVR